MKTLRHQLRVLSGIGLLSVGLLAGPVRQLTAEDRVITLGYAGNGTFYGMNYCGWVRETGYVEWPQNGNYLVQAGTFNNGKLDTRNFLQVDSSTIHPAWHLVSARIRLHNRSDGYITYPAPTGNATYRLYEVADIAWQVPPTYADLGDGTLQGSVVITPQVNATGDVVVPLNSAALARLKARKRVAFGGVLSLDPGQTAGYLFSGSGQTDDYSVVEVTVTNQPPTLSGVADVAILEDAAGQLPITVADDGGGAAVVVTATSSNPALIPASALAVQTTSVSGRRITFLPHANQSGSAVITVSASDGLLATQASFTVTVAPVNDAPVATAQSLVVTEDIARAVTLAGTDVEGSVLTYAIAKAPAKGVLSGSGANRTYTPNANATGSDVFTFTVHDGGLTSAPATVSITISPVNDAPVATAQNVTVTEDVARAITLAGSDAEGSPLTFAIGAGPTKGVLTGSGASRTYTPNANATGSDAFTFTVSDGALTSAAATVSITIAAVNDAPSALPQSVVVTEDTPQAITLSGTDIEGSALIYAISTAPTKGVLSGSGASRIYTPHANATGSDAFAFTVRDGSLTSAPATVSISITPVDDAPVATAQSVTVTEDVARAITLAGSDAEGSPLTFAIATAPTKGVLTGSGASRTYTPNANATGNDAFTFTVSDGALTSAPAKVSITIAAVNDAPVAVGKLVTVTEDVAKAIGLAGSDPDGDPLTYAIVSPPLKGVLSGSGSSRTYTPNANASGADQFTFTVSDGVLTSAPATVGITITAVNDAPVADPQTLDVPAGAALAIVLTASDADGDALTYSIVTAPTQGVLGGTGAQRTYTPNPGAIGSDRFTFRVSDGKVFSAAATVALTIAPLGMGTGLAGTYFDNIDFTGATVTRIDPVVDFNWDTGAPIPGISPDTFSVRWSGQIQAPVSGDYAFHIRADDGIRLWIDGQLIIDRWIDQSSTEWSAQATLVAGRSYDIVFEFYENFVYAEARLMWTPPGGAKAVIPQKWLYPMPSAIGCRGGAAPDALCRGLGAEEAGRPWDPRFPGSNQRDGDCRQRVVGAAIRESPQARI